MYILGILCSLRLYQARHHDVFINGHFAFAGFAFVIFTAVIGVVSFVLFLFYLLLGRKIPLYRVCQKRTSVRFNVWDNSLFYTFQTSSV